MLVDFFWSNFGCFLQGGLMPLGRRKKLGRGGHLSLDLCIGGGKGGPLSDLEKRGELRFFDLEKRPTFQINLVDLIK